MLRFYLLILFSFFSLFADSQFRVTLFVTVPEYAKKSNLFVAGNHNAWNPASNGSQLTANQQDQFILELTNISGSFSFKITKGAWETVECSNTGTDISNRDYTISSDTIIRIQVAGFKDHFGQVPQIKTHTASRQVHIVEEKLFIPKLNTNRRIWIYLPKAYGNKKRFPVLYMHDGQNLFDKATAFGEEWGIDEYLDSVQKNCIVVGIDNGGNSRMAEYNYFKNSYENAPSGKAYGHFIVHQLIPYINKNYKTKKGKQHTFIAGSSMGGLISFLIAMEYPKVFGKAGVFSPSFWINYAEVQQLIEKARTIKNQDFYFYAGLSESKNLEKEVKGIYENLIPKRKKSLVIETFYAEGTHDEKSWREQLPSFFHWLLQ